MVRLNIGGCGYKPVSTDQQHTLLSYIKGNAEFYSVKRQA